MIDEIIVPYGPFLEEWRGINNYIDRYEISNYGNVRSKDVIIDRVKNGSSNTPASFIKKGKKVAITDNGHGYKISSLSNKGRKNHYVHRLVAEMFIPNPNFYNEVNHINAIKCNNVFYNLEWCSKKQNAQHASINNLIQKGKEKHNAISVINIKSKQIFECISFAGKYYGIKYGLLKEGLKRNTNYKDLDYLHRWTELHPLEAKKMGLSFDRLNK